MPINRSDAEALIATQLISAIVQNPVEESTFMRLARRLPNMTSDKTRMRVLDLLPLAYWVNGDTGFKQTSEQAWANVYLDAEECAVIVPIPEAVLNDADTDIMGEVTPRVKEAIAKLVDAAIIFGANKPASWRADIITSARQAGNNVAGAATLTYDKLLGTGGVIAKVEEDGYAISGAVSALTMRAKLRGIKDDAGNPLFKSDMQGPTPYSIDGAPMYFPKNGSFNTSIAEMIVGDWSQAVYSIRQDITVKILDQAVIQNPADNSIAFNLAQQDMIALRVVFRMGWAMPIPASQFDPNRTSCPFAYLEPASAYTDYSLTFTVNDSSSVAIEGAAVEVNGARILTNASGQAVFHLRNGSYTYKVSKRGKIAATGSKTISSANATETVALASQS